MEGGKLRAVVVVMVVVGMVIGQSTASFKDCYIKCYVFCMIEPSQTLCSCSTHCFKDCIFPDPPQHHIDHYNAAADNNYHAFCTLGCASSFCSNISTKHNPSGDNVEKCVGSCSKRCIN